MKEKRSPIRPPTREELLWGIALALALLLCALVMDGRDVGAIVRGIWGR